MNYKLRGEFGDKVWQRVCDSWVEGRDYTSFVRDTVADELCEMTDRDLVDALSDLQNDEDEEVMELIGRAVTELKSYIADKIILEE